MQVASLPMHLNCLLSSAIPYLPGHPEMSYILTTTETRATRTTMATRTTKTATRTAGTTRMPRTTRETKKTNVHTRADGNGEDGNR